MAQPSGQALLQSANAAEYFYYAQGSGIFDAKNNAMLSKTGTAGMAVEGGANVALGNGTTYYSLSSSVTVTGDWSLVFRARTSAANNAAMMCGLNTATTDFVWLNNGSNSLVYRGNAGDHSVSNSTSTTTSTWIIVHNATAQTVSLYKDGTQVGSALSTSGNDPAFKLNVLLNGYTGTSLCLNGAFEMLNLIPSKLDSTGIAARTADPYAVLAASAVNGTASGGTGTSTGSGSGGAASAVSNSIAITTPAAYKMHQRNGSNVADIAVSVTWTGSPLSIEARFNGGSWATLIASPAGGAGSGTLTNCPVGQGSIDVRFSNATTVTASVSTIGVGDIFIVAGQSNNAGRATQKVDPVASAFTAVKYGRDGVWKVLTEATTQSGSFDEGGSAAGSYFGQLSNLLQANGVPVAFVPCAIGSTTIANWQPPSPHTNTSFAYGIALTRAQAVGDHKALIWYQGESDTATAQATFEAGTNTVIDTWYADTGRPTFLIKICNWSGSSGTVRAGQDNVIAGNAHVVGSADANLWTGDVHYLTTTQISAVASAVYSGMVAAFYGTSATAAGGTGTGTGSGSGGTATGGSSETPLTTADIPAIAAAVIAAINASTGSKTIGDHLRLQSAVLMNKMITDPATGVLTVYDDDGATPLMTANIFKDAAGTVPYNGTGAERRERLA